MSRLPQIFKAYCVLLLLSLFKPDCSTASKEKVLSNHTTLLTSQPLKIRSTGPIVTNHNNVEPFGDTFCVSDETGQRLSCNGVEKNTCIECQPISEGQIQIRADALTMINNRAIRCPQTSETDKSINDTDLKITGTSSQQKTGMNAKSLCTINLSDLASIALKQEPPDPDAESSHLFVVPKSKKIRNTFCSGCQEDFKTASKLSNHRRTSTAPTCKGGYSTVCSGCQEDFKTGSKLNNHRQTSTAPACKGRYSTVCSGCQKDFKTASKLSNHRRTSTAPACKAKAKR